MKLRAPNLQLDQCFVMLRKSSALSEIEHNTDLLFNFHPSPICSLYCFFMLKTASNNDSIKQKKRDVSTPTPSSVLLTLEHQAPIGTNLIRYKTFHDIKFSSHLEIRQAVVILTQ